VAGFHANSSAGVGRRSGAGWKGQGEVAMGAGNMEAGKGALRGGPWAGAWGARPEQGALRGGPLLGLRWPRNADEVG
jgi:hypothetical protein